MVENRYQKIWDISACDEQLIKKRKKNARIITLLKYLRKMMTPEDYEKPIIDSQVLLSHILNLLDDENFAVSRNEVLTAFNRFFSQKNHGSKRTYLKWMYDEFNIKKGTRVKSGKNTSQKGNKTPVTQLKEGENANSNGFQKEVKGNTNKTNNRGSER